MNRKIKGISLIVLVITIIVIIILAGAVILSLASSDVISKANLAKESNDFASIRQVLEMERTALQLERKTFDPTNAANVNVKIPSTYSNEISVTNDGTVIIKSVEDSKITDMANAIEKLGAVYIPKGFIVSDVSGESSKENGLVIYDNSPVSGVVPGEVSTDLDAKTTRNQFVWVPVENYNEFVRENFNKLNQNIPPTKFITTLPVGLNYFELAESTVLPYEGTSTIQIEVNAMYASVKKYRGFYIARYEASINNGVVESKKGKTACKGYKWGGAQSPVPVASDGANGNELDTTGAVYQSRQMYLPGSNPEGYPVSTLIYGVQWDALMRWYNAEGINVEDSRSWGNYNNSTAPANVDSGSLRTTGYSENWKAKNIYDIAGNVHEWTMEAFPSSCRVLRGGAFESSGGTGSWPRPAADRNYYDYYRGLMYSRF